MQSQSLFARLRGKFFHFYFLMKRPMTLGVRALVLDESNQSIFLVRHTYVPGWHLPGGGVERGQTLRQALDMELVEEGHIALTSEPQLFGVYLNSRASIRDHVAFYVCRSFQQEKPRQPDKEIAEAGFFRLDALPKGVTAATLRRIGEVMSNVPAEALW